MQNSTRNKQKVYLVIISIFTFLILIRTGYSADIYRWKDKDGNVHISDTPKPNNMDNAQNRQKSENVNVNDISQNVDKNPISEIPRQRAREDLKRELRDRYGSSYSTIEMLLKSNMEDYDKLCDIPDTSVNTKILKDLRERYYPSFSTILMLFKSDKESYESLQ